MKTRIIMILMLLAGMTLQARQSGIKVRFLGTGAADWNGVDERGEHRRCSSILVDGEVLVDLTAESLEMIPEGCNPKVIFYTHSHNDHFDPEAALKTGVERVYVGATWFERARSRFHDASASLGLPMPQIIPLDTQECVSEHGLFFTALPANHATSDLHEQALIYLIEKEGVRVLYATDTGGLMADATQGIGIDAHKNPGRPIHGFIMEATMGMDGDEDFRIFAHSSVNTVLRTVHVLQKTGRYTPAEGQAAYLTHMARTLHGTQAELDATLPEPLKAAYDGLEVIFTK